MKLASSLVFLAVAAACAHAPRVQTQRIETTVHGGQGNRSIILRYEQDDDKVAQQVRRALDVAVPVAERWGVLSAPVTITIHATHAALEVAAGRSGYAWLRAWSRRESVELQSPRTWSRGEASDAELTQLLAHELTHCAMYQALGRDADRAHGMPIWFREGMATTNAGERLVAASRPPTSSDPLRKAALLYRTEAPLVYVTADRAFRFLAHRYGEDRIHRLLEKVRDGAAFPEAFQDVMGLAIDAFEDEFRSQLAQEKAQG